MCRCNTRLLGSKRGATSPKFAERILQSETKTPLGKSQAGKGTTPGRSSSWLYIDRSSDPNRFPRDGRQIPASKGERTLLFMESAKPTIFLEPTVAAAARGQVLVRARVAVRRATESMVLICLIGLLMLDFFMTRRQASEVVKWESSNRKPRAF